MYQIASRSNKALCLTFFSSDKVFLKITLLSLSIIESLSNNTKMLFAKKDFMLFCRTKQFEFPAIGDVMHQNKTDVDQSVLRAVSSKWELPENL